MTKKLAVVLVAGFLGLMGERPVNASLANGLVAYWPLDEGSGTTAVDAVGTNDGIISGGAVYANGVGIAPIPGNVDALTFDGVDDFVTVPHAAVLDVTTTYTISVWLNMAFVARYQPILFRGTATANDIEVYWFPGQALTVVHNRRSGNDYDGAVYFASPPTGALFHLAVVFDGTAVQAYYNGLPAALSGTGCCGFSTALPPPLATNKEWRIGKVDHLAFTVPNLSVPQFFDGLMDEARIYNRTLSASEIAALAQPAAAGPLVAAVLPSSRAVQVGTPATAFAIIVNTGAITATSCLLSPLFSLPATFHFRPTDCATNLVTGVLDTPMDIPSAGQQCFVFTFTPTAPIDPTDVVLSFDCANTTPAPVFPRVNTFLFSAASMPVSDIIALVATIGNTGIVNIPGATGTGVFSVATVNVGAGGMITVVVDTGGVNLPVNLTFCQTDPMTGACLAPPSHSVTTLIDAGATPTFGIFVQGLGTVPFAPATNRVFVWFKDAGNLVRGGTSVAVRTQ